MFLLAIFEKFEVGKCLLMSRRKWFMFTKAALFYLFTILFVFSVKKGLFIW